MDESKNPDHIDELKRRLDSALGSTTIHKRQGVLHDTHINIPTDWDIKSDTVRHATKLVEQTLFHNSMFKKFFIGSIIFFICAVVVATLIFFGGNNTVSSNYIDISVIGSSYASGGEDLPLQILVTNNNPVAIELADLFIEYPKGTASDNGSDVVRLLKSIGSLNSGDTTTIPVTPLLYGEQGSVVEITMRLEYRVSGSNSIFTKEKKYGVTLNTSPLDISVTAPTEVVSNQEIEFKISAKSNTSRVSENMRLQVEYPPGFQFISADPEPLYGNSVWGLGDLAQGAEREVVIHGTLLGTNGDENIFHIFGGSEDTKDKTKVGIVYNSLVQIVTIKKAFINAEISIENKTDNIFITNGNGPVQINVNYENSLSVKVTDVELSVRLSGNALNPNTVTTRDGYYDASNKTIIWSKDTYNKLAVLNPSDSGSVSFSITPKPLSEQAGTFIHDPSITIDVSVKGRQPSEGNIVQEARGVDSNQIKIATDFQLLLQSIYSTGAFVNSGPIPPRAGQETTYTIKWSLKNTVNPISGAIVTASLPLWADFTGESYPTSEKIVYDDISRKITWNIGAVARATGFSSNTTREVSFQVKLKASSSQIGQSPNLVLSPTLSGIDSWTGDTIQAVKQTITTKISTDATYGASTNHSVVQ